MEDENHNPVARVFYGTCRGCTVESKHDSSGSKSYPTFLEAASPRHRERILWLGGFEVHLRVDEQTMVPPETLISSHDASKNNEHLAISLSIVSSLEQEKCRITGSGV